MRALLAFVVFSAALLVGCSSRSKKPATASEVSSEFKLKKDRSALERLRKDVPEEVKSQNDESAYLLSLFQDAGKNPQAVSSRFNDDVRRKRDEFSKWERQTRENFNRKENQRREDYMAEAKKKREDPGVKKMKSDERSRFFQDVETDRRQYFFGESDSRKNLDSELRQKRSDFEAQMRDLRTRFDHEYKTYSKDYNEKKKSSGGSSVVQQVAPKSSVPAGFTDKDMRDLESIPQGKKSSLGD